LTYGEHFCDRIKVTNDPAQQLADSHASVQIKLEDWHVARTVSLDPRLQLGFLFHAQEFHTRVVLLQFTDSGRWVFCHLSVLNANPEDQTPGSLISVLGCTLPVTLFIQPADDFVLGDAVGRSIAKAGPDTLELELQIVCRQVCLCVLDRAVDQIAKSEDRSRRCFLFRRWQDAVQLLAPEFSQLDDWPQISVDLLPFIFEM
jgi:hypothetical protein